MDYTWYILTIYLVRVPDDAGNKDAAAAAAALAADSDSDEAAGRAARARAGASWRHSAARPARASKSLAGLIPQAFPRVVQLPFAEPLYIMNVVNLKV